MNDSKEHIILTATKLFLKKSYKEVTLKEIIKETGLSNGALYHHFENKEQLFLETIKYFFQTITRNYDTYSKDSLYQFYNDFIDDGIEMLQNFILKAYGKNADENYVTINYFSLVFDLLKISPDFRDKLIKLHSEELTKWTKIVKIAREKGEIETQMTDETVGKIFMYLSDGTGIQQILRGYDVKGMLSPFREIADNFYNQIKT